MAIDEADRQELMVARDIRTTLNMILDQLRLSGPRKLDLTIAIDPATLAALAKIFGPKNVTSFKVTVDQPISQTRSTQMANVRRFAAAASPQTMLDDQMALMHVTPQDSNGNPTSLPTGAAVPTYSAAPGTAVTLDPSVDATGLSCNVKGIKGQAGVEVVTVSFTNPDGTIATGTAQFTQSIDPAALDIAGFGVTVDTPVAQTPAAPVSSRRP